MISLDLEEEERARAKSFLNHLEKRNKDVIHIAFEMFRCIARSDRLCSGFGLGGGRFVYIKSKINYVHASPPHSPNSDPNQSLHLQDSIIGYQRHISKYRKVNAIDHTD